MAVCTKCEAILADGAELCGSCGAATTPTAAAASCGLPSNVAAMLAYFTIIPAILFLVLDPYNKDKFVRFHAFQSLFYGVTWIAVSIAGTILTSVLAFIPVLGWLLDMVFWLVVGLGGFVLWIILVYKAYGNQKFALPMIGKLAEEQAAK